ncbi:hypothetical protein HNP73_000815 [Amaricoccus macauensis]|uniref:Uncharacterized protein n=1 Tax=Amaricoccus macauensis TaxID=57001 RepID=A0A840SIX3_9RHOB|nr:hypothetical protein [Amaricoccus macauensis]MBB5220894.1 hypothetical protein [Amaricoccus macauensis]
MSQTDEIDELLNTPPAPPRAAVARRRSLWEREFPYLLILVLAAAGAGWVSLTREPIVRYWDVVAVVVAAVAIVEGWHDAEERGGRWRLVWTQLAHWAAFLIAMNLVFLPSMQSVLTSDALSLTVLLLLALGTFASGIHTASPLMAANGVFMGLCVPAIAWLDQTAMIVVLVIVVLASAVALFFWLRRRYRG